jgi:hypothetical protein
MNNSSLEIQKFLNSVKEDIEQSNETCDTISFVDFWNKKHDADDTNFDMRAFLSDVTLMQSSNQISYYHELTSYRRGISVIVKPIKKVIRKLVAFLFLPIVAEQNNVNASVARLAMHLRGFVNKDNSYRQYVVKHDKELEIKLRDQRLTINELTEKIQQLTERIEALENGGNDR